MKKILVLSMVLVSLCVRAEELPIGFYSLDSEKIPKALREKLKSVAKGVGRIEIRLKEDLNGLKKGHVVGSGSGYVIGPGDVAKTNSHVIQAWKQNPEKLSLYFVIPAGEFELTEVLNDDPKKDIATLKLPRAVEGISLTGEVSKDSGMDVVTFGYPLGCKAVKVAFGKVVKNTGEDLFLTSPSLPGNSGGPILTFKGDSVQVVATAKAIRAIQTQALRDGMMISRDFATQSVLNLLLHTLLTLPDPTKQLKIVEMDGELTSEILAANFVRDQRNIDVWAVFRNREVASWQVNKTEWSNRVQGWLDDAKRLKKKLTDGVIDQSDAVDGLENINFKLIELEEGLMFGGREAEGYPIVPSANLDSLRSEEDVLQTIDGIVAGLESLLAGRAEVLERLEEKTQFFNSDDAILRLVKKVEKDRAYLQSDEHYNQHFFFVPTIGAVD